MAALWVVLYHCQDAAHANAEFSPLRGVSVLSEGFRGVDLFFLLSGFILFYVHAEDFHNLTWPAARSYIAARFWRVYPLNAVVLGLIIATAWWLPGFRDPAGFTPGALIQSFLLAQRWLMPDLGSINGPAWSLSVEIIGYAAFPFIAWGLARNHAPLWHLAAAGLCLSGLVAASYPLGFADSNITGRLTILRMFPAFIAGIALSALFRSQARSIAPYAGALATGAALAVVILCAIPVWPALTVFPLAALVLALACERGPVGRFMASPPVVWLGRVSFSLYLTHFTVLHLLIWLTPHVEPGPLPRWAYMSAIFAAMLAVAAIVYYTAERPLTRLSRRFGRRPAPSRAVSQTSRADPSGAARLNEA